MELKDRINVFHFKDGRLERDEKKSEEYSEVSKIIDKRERKWAYTVKYTESGKE